MRRIHVVVALAALIGACSQESSVTSSPGCALADGRCVASDSATEAACSAQYGTWLAAGCPSAERVGACASSTEITSYYSPYWSASGAEYDCDGTWSPEPPPYVPPPTGGGTTEATMSCTIAGFFCIDMSGAFPQATIDTFETDCTEVGTMGSGPCALEGALPGYCSMLDEDYGAGTARFFTSSEISTLAEARADCEQSAGIWVD